jgi:hypothetical protein
MHDGGCASAQPLSIAANRPFFVPCAERAGKHLFSDKSSIPQCLLFLFFKKRKRTLLKKRNRSPIPFRKKTSS